MATAERIKVINYVKDKNIIHFYTNRNKPYDFDINKTMWFGLTGKELVKMPPVVADYVHKLCWNSETSTSILMLLNRYCGTYSRYYNTRLFLLCDRFTSLGLKVKPAHIGNDLITMIEDNFKVFIQWAKEQQNNSTYVHPELFATYIIEKEYRDKITKMCNPNTPKALIDMLVRFAYQSKEYYETEHNLKCACYWAERTLGYRHMLVSSGYRREDFATDRANECSFDTVTISGELIDFFKLAKKMNYTPDKSDFEKQYIALKKDYWVQRVYKDNQNIANFYNKYADNLLFENDKYKVVLLDTVDKLCNESRIQQNCIAHSYIPAILDNRCLIVSIRDKDNMEMPIVSCEIRLDGRINQYLRQYNGWVDSSNCPDLFKFKQQYQNYLYSKKWGE